MQWHVTIVIVWCDIAAPAALDYLKTFMLPPVHIKESEGGVTTWLRPESAFQNICLLQWFDSTHWNCFGWSHISSTSFECLACLSKFSFTLIIFTKMVLLNNDLYWRKWSLFYWAMTYLDWNGACFFLLNNALFWPE